jgi:molybdenum cofactor biosynthesis enzyme MoaA
MASRLRREAALFSFENSPADDIPADPRNDIVPGRGDLRISLTSACNLKCSYCHNEGQSAPWLNPPKTSARFANIEGLLEVATKYGIKSVKFSGGDPGVYLNLLKLLETIVTWRRRFPSVKKWGICTNGTPFLDPKKFDALARSALDNISIGIDSVEPGERSKPSSRVGVEGTVLMEQFVEPLAELWNERLLKKERYLKLDVVFRGDKRQTTNVIRAGRRLGINVSILEICGVMGPAEEDVRNAFLELIAETAAEFRLEAKLHKPLNEFWLYDGEKTPIKFYQDHCRDRDCGHCRNIHLRVSPTGDGWGAVPCFLQAQSRIIPLVVDGRMSAERFEDAIRYNGRGPSWFADTPYENLY